MEARYWWEVGGGSEVGEGKKKKSGEKMPGKAHSGLPQGLDTGFGVTDFGSLFRV